MECNSLAIELRKVLCCFCLVVSLFRSNWFQDPPNKLIIIISKTKDKVWSFCVLRNFFFPFLSVCLKVYICSFSNRKTVHVMKYFIYLMWSSSVWLKLVILAAFFFFLASSIEQAVSGVFRCFTVICLNRLCFLSPVFGWIFHHMQTPSLQTLFQICNFRFKRQHLWTVSSSILSV